MKKAEATDKNRDMGVEHVCASADDVSAGEECPREIDREKSLKNQ
jgi:hypothetical protein